MKRSIICILLLCALLLSNVLLAACSQPDATPDAGTVTRMTVDINPSVEIMIDEENKVTSITALNDGLRDFKGVVIFTSHDHEFIQTIANRIIRLEKDGVTDFRGTYDEFIESRRARGEHL